MSTLYFNGTLSAEVNDVQESQVRIFPVPFNNELHINNGAEHNLQLKFYDLLGRHLKTISSNQSDTPIDTSSWTSGIYLVEVENTTNGTVEIKKLIKK